jgi:serine protease
LLVAAILAATVIASGVTAPAASAAGPQPEPPTLPPIFKIDEELVPTETLPDGPDGTPRRPAAIVDEYGHRGLFIEDELIVVSDDLKTLNAVLDRWHGEVVATIDPAEHDISGASRQHLVRLDPTAADSAELPGLLAELQPTRDISHRVSSERALQLFTVAALEAKDGLTVGINWLGTSADIPGGATLESPTGPAGFNTDRSVYSGNAFDWFYLRDGGTLDIGVTEAWTILARTGRLDERVRIAVLDGGFAPATNGDFPAGFSARSVVPGEAAIGSSNPGSCTGGASCPWHGTNVANAVAGAVDNRAGAAGPAGPVADLVVIHELADMFSSAVALGLAYHDGARIANMSWSGEVPASVAFTALPFDSVTRMYRSLGMLLFAAAGNDNMGVDETDCFILSDLCWEEEWVFPCENGGVICVGGVDTRARTSTSGDPRGRAPGSNYGLRDVDLFAPYTVLVGPDPASGPGAQAVNGTSFAAPFAAGVAALVWAADPGQSADAVESILISTANASPHPQVTRIVNAGSAVASAASRTVRMVSPADGLLVSHGRPVELNADVFEDGFGPADVRWTSGGRSLGAGLRTFSTDFVVGRQEIVVTATWPDGTSVTDSVTIEVRNDPPTVEILNPATGAFLEQSQTVSWSARTFDPNVGGPLPDTAVTWHLDGAASPFARGHAPTTALPPTTVGDHNVVVRATDGAATTSASIRINVVADDGVPDPTGHILNPSNDAFLVTNWIGPEGQPVHRLILRTDAPGPSSPPVTLIWFDSVDHGPAVEIARGTAPTVDLVGAGCGTSHLISLFADDITGHRHPIDTVLVTVAPAVLC